MNIGIKERQKYRDITWLMPSIDVVDILHRIGAEKVSTHGNEVLCLCPDHQMFVDRISSHPNWFCEVETGWTYCRTEPRSSNLVWTVCRLLDCNPNDAVLFMTGRDVAHLDHLACLNRIANMKKQKSEMVVDPVGLDNIRTDLVNRFISEGCYGFFIHPPGKNQTNITKETVDRYMVFERTWGYYSNRAIIPFFMRQELVGFCAIDLLGKNQWILEHPLKDENDYKKTLYPLNFQGKSCLFGFDDCERGAASITVTEGAREVMKLSQEGFPNSVGCLKAELSDEQIMLLTELSPKEIVLMFDGDEAGWAATEKNAAKLSPIFKVRKCYLPVGKDPKNLVYSEIKNIQERAKPG